MCGITTSIVNYMPHLAVCYADIYNVRGCALRETMKRKRSRAHMMSVIAAYR